MKELAGLQSFFELRKIGVRNEGKIYIIKSMTKKTEWTKGQKSICALMRARLRERR